MDVFFCIGVIHLEGKQSHKSGKIDHFRACRIDGWGIVHQNLLLQQLQRYIGSERFENFLKLQTGD